MVLALASPGHPAVKGAATAACARQGRGCPGAPGRAKAAPAPPGAPSHRRLSSSSFAGAPLSAKGGGFISISDRVARPRRLPGGAHVVARQSGSGGENLLVMDGLRKSHDGERILFDGLSCTVSRGQKMAIVGENGCGKSTFLRIISDEDKPDEGFVQRSKGLRVGYLAQEPDLDLSMSVLDAVIKADTPMGQAVVAYEAALAQHALLEGASGSAAQLEQASTRMDAEGAWEMVSEAKIVISVLGLEDPAQKVGELSGGQRKRVALAAALLANPDVLILDEPTNHMDIGAIEWMEKRLNDPALTLLLVTHDRYFMEQVCNQILEIDGGEAFVHRIGGTGSYNKFMEMRWERRSAAMQRVREAKNTLRKESDWMARQPKARSTKSRARIERFHDLSAAAKAGPSKDTVIQLSADMTRQGKKILELKDVGVSFGSGEDSKVIFKDFSVAFDKGQRLGVVGPNGAGKSTLLDVMAGKAEPTVGGVVVGETTVVGYYTQYPPDVPGDLKIIDYVRTYVERQAKADNIDIGPGGALPVETILEKVGFPRKRQNVLAGSLSGGERRRLHLATVLLRRPNFLILDEPTNDLDLQTIEVLEEFLAEYAGVLVTVSHDRAFMDNVADKLLVLPGDGTVQLFEGTYSEYADYVREEGKAAAAEAAAEARRAKEEAAKAVGGGGGGADPAVGEVKLKRLSYMEEREYASLEKEIEDVTEELEGVASEMAAAASDFTKLGELGEQHQALEARLEEVTERWLVLAERAEAYA